MNASALLIVLLVAGCQAPTAGASAQENSDSAKPTAGEVSRRDAASKGVDEFRRNATGYRIATATEPPGDLSLVREPVLRWTNPLRGSVVGVSFVWVADGRPEAIGSFYRYDEDGKVVEDNEFQSLATTGLTATRDGQPVWAPRDAGLTLAPIPGAPKPAASPVERLRQMRALAQEFHASFDLPEDHTELRLLPQPPYRYHTKRPDFPDGALFAFVLTTDPEVLLAIEDRPVDGVPTWQYGFARMSMVNLRARHKGRDVWSADWASDFRNPRKPYVTLRAPIRTD